MLGQCLLHLCAPRLVLRTSIVSPEADEDKFVGAAHACAPRGTFSLAFRTPPSRLLLLSKRNGFGLCLARPYRDDWSELIFAQLTYSARNEQTVGYRDKPPWRHGGSFRRNASSRNHFRRRLSPALSRPLPSATPTRCRQIALRTPKSRTLCRAPCLGLLADVAAGEVDRVVVYRLDRLARRLTHCAAILRELREHDVAFTVITSPVLQ
ncbi:MAG: recombinase family protein [Pirellulales bacterium]